MLPKAPSIYSFDSLRRCTLGHMTSASSDGKTWHPARPMGFYSIAGRLKAAWLVFTGQADALVWPGGQ